MTPRPTLSVPVYDVPGHAFVLVDCAAIPKAPLRWCLIPVNGYGWAVRRFRTTGVLANATDPVAVAAAMVAEAVDAAREVSGG